MKSFEHKKQELVKLKEKLAKAKLVVLSSFARGSEKGLNVSEMRGLKKDLKAVEAEYVISKKTLFNKAIKKGGKGMDVFQFEGSLGAALGYGDEQSAAKAVYNFAKKHPALKCLGAIWGNKVFDTVQFAEFAKLPAREILIARLLGMMKYPISALANVLDQIAKKQ